MFTSLKRPNRYTKCTKKTLIKQTLCVDSPHEHQHQNQHIFGLSPFDVTLNQPPSHPEHKENLSHLFLLRKKFHNLLVESDQCFKSSLSLRMVLHKKMKCVTFSSLSWRSPSWDWARWAEKKFLSFSLEFCFLSAGGRESFLGHKKPFCVQQPLAPRVYVWVCLLDLRECVCVCVFADDRDCVSAFVEACVHAHGAVVMAFRSFMRPSRWAISSVNSSGS